MSDARTPGRNDPCRCGSGKKYKQCCLDKDEAAARAARQKAADAAAAEAPTEPQPEARAAQPKPKRQATSQPWKRGSQNTRGFAKVSATRKVGSG